MAPVEKSGSSSAAKGSVVKKVRHAPRTIVFGDSAAVVRHGEVTQEVAAAVWAACVRDWTGSESNETAREALHDIVTQALVQSTSKDVENLGTKFKFNNEWHTVRPIYDNMVVHAGDNDSHLRVFARSYNYGYFAAAMFDAVSEPSNIEVRMELAARSEGPVEHAPYMIDVFDALIRHSGRVFSSAEIALYNRYKSNRTNKARESAQSVGESAPRNDTTTSSKPKGPSPVHSAPAPSAGRLSFASLK